MTVARNSATKLLGRIMTGRVVANSGGPGGNKFIRVRIPGIDRDEIPDDRIPWSGVGRPLFRGGGDGVGMGSIPRIGSKVAGFFDGGSRDSFVALWEIDDPTTTTEYDQNTWGIRDEAGTYITVRVGQTLTIHHQGTTITIDSSGNVTENVAGNKATTIAGNYTIKVGGDMRANASNIYLND